LKLSICIATYNRARFIGQTLDSILGEMVPGVEVVVVDGASPDDTPSVMFKYQGDVRVRYFRETINSGVDGDYDKAVGYARGEYCWLMTDDDLLFPGALARLVRALDGSCDLVVVNAAVYDADFSRVLRERLMLVSEDKRYGAQDSEDFFVDTASYLSFIGGVVIKRAVWMARERLAFAGTLFVHMGVIFQRPILQTTMVIADPVLKIRYGNAMWTSRSFEIWMFKWPRLIWSFDQYSAKARTAVSAREPWRRLSELCVYRATGAYSLGEYRRFLRDALTPLQRTAPLLVALLPGRAMNALISVYSAVFYRKPMRMYDLSNSPHSTWLTRLLARSVVG
jgi:glycosyltransferase involved in cell wall biosynthesis